MLTDRALKNVQSTLASCDELIYGRFIFAENIISKILQNISESQEIYGLIAECMQNFNFDREFNKAKVKLPTKEGYFVMPESKAIILPLVFCILVDIRDKKINFHDFIKNYFMSENLNEFENFAQTVILPFRNAIAYCFDLEKTTTETQIENNEVEQTNIELENQTSIEDLPNDPQPNFNDTKVSVFLDSEKIIIKQMLDELKSDKKVKENLKNDLEYILLAMLDCMDKLDIKNLSAYIVAIDYIAKPVRSLKFLAQELRQKMIEFYI